MSNDATRASTSVPVNTASASSSDFHELLPRLTKKVFTDLGIWMTGLGLLMGIVFPFFVMAFGVPSDYVLSAKFFAATIGAGLVVGATSQFLSRAVVGSRLRFMSSKMSKVEATLREATTGDDEAACTPEKCMIAVDSDDELGDAAASFNLDPERLTGTSPPSMVEEFLHVALRPVFGAGTFDRAAKARRIETLPPCTAQSSPTVDPLRVPGPPSNGDARYSRTRFPHLRRVEALRTPPGT